MTAQLIHANIPAIVSPTTTMGHDCFGTDRRLSFFIAHLSSLAIKAFTGDGPGKICKHVVSPEPGTKHYKLCLTKVEWAAKEKADARNPNRTVCRYVAHSGSIFKSYKVCMTAAEWENQRQLDRQQIERLQRGSCVAGGGCRAETTGARRRASYENQPTANSEMSALGRKRTLIAGQFYAHTLLG